MPIDPGLLAYQNRERYVPPPGMVPQPPPSIQQSPVAYLQQAQQQQAYASQAQAQQAQVQQGYAANPFFQSDMFGSPYTAQPSGDGGGGILGGLMKAVSFPLYAYDAGRRGIMSGLAELQDLVHGKEASWDDFMEQFNDPTFGFGDLIPSTGNKWLDRAIGFAGDVVLDPMTYVTAGTSKFIGSAGRAGLAARAAEAGLPEATVKAIGRVGEHALSAEQRGLLGMEKAGLRFGLPSVNVRIPGTGGLARGTGYTLGGVRRPFTDTWVGTTARRFGAGGARDPRFREAVNYLATGKGPFENATNAANVYASELVRDAARNEWRGDFRALQGKLADELAGDTTVARAVERGLDTPEAQKFSNLGQLVYDRAQQMGAKGLPHRQNWFPHYNTTEFNEFLEHAGKDGGRYIDLPGAASGRFQARKFEPYSTIKIQGTPITFGRADIDDITEKFWEAFPTLKGVKLIEDDPAVVIPKIIDDMAEDVGRAARDLRLERGRSLREYGAPGTTKETMVRPDKKARAKAGKAAETAAKPLLEERDRLLDELNVYIRQTAEAVQKQDAGLLDRAQTNLSRVNQRLDELDRGEAAIVAQKADIEGRARKVHAPAQARADALAVEMDRLDGVIQTLQRQLSEQWDTNSAAALRMVQERRARIAQAIGRGPEATRAKSAVTKRLGRLREKIGGQAAAGEAERQAELAALMNETTGAQMRQALLESPDRATFVARLASIAEDQPVRTPAEIEAAEKAATKIGNLLATGSSGKKVGTMAYGDAERRAFRGSLTATELARGDMLSPQVLNSLPPEFRAELEAASRHLDERMRPFITERPPPEQLPIEEPELLGAKIGPTPDLTAAERAELEDAIADLAAERQQILAGRDRGEPLPNAVVARLMDINERQRALIREVEAMRPVRPKGGVPVDVAANAQKRAALERRIQDLQAERAAAMRPGTEVFEEEVPAQTVTRTVTEPGEVPVDPSEFERAVLERQLANFQSQLAYGTELSATQRGHLEQQLAQFTEELNTLRGTPPSFLEERVANARAKVAGLEAQLAERLDPKRRVVLEQRLEQAKAEVRERLEVQLAAPPFSAPPPHPSVARSQEARATQLERRIGMIQAQLDTPRKLSRAKRRQLERFINKTEQDLAALPAAPTAADITREVTEEVPARTRVSLTQRAGRPVTEIDAEMSRVIDELDRLRAGAPGARSAREPRMKYKGQAFLDSEVNLATEHSRRLHQIAAHYYRALQGGARPGDETLRMAGVRVLEQERGVAEESLRQTRRALGLEHIEDQVQADWEEMVRKYEQRMMEYDRRSRELRKMKPGLKQARAERQLHMPAPLPNEQGWKQFQRRLRSMGMGTQDEGATAANKAMTVEFAKVLQPIAEEAGDAVKLYDRVKAWWNRATKSARQTQGVKLRDPSQLRMNAAGEIYFAGARTRAMRDAARALNIDESFGEDAVFASLLSYARMEKFEARRVFKDTLREFTGVRWDNREANNIIERVGKGVRVLMLGDTVVQKDEVRRIALADIAASNKRMSKKSLAAIEQELDDAFGKRKIMQVWARYKTGDVKWLTDVNDNRLNRVLGLGEGRSPKSTGLRYVRSKMDAATEASLHANDLLEYIDEYVDMPRLELLQRLFNGMSPEARSRLWDHVSDAAYSQNRNLIDITERLTRLGGAEGQSVLAPVTETLASRKLPKVIEPPLKPGMIRLYRGEPVVPFLSPEVARARRAARGMSWIDESPAMQARDSVQGRWFHTERGQAARYPFDLMDEESQLRYIDVTPEEYARIEGLKDQPQEVRDLSRAPNEVVIPPEWMNRVRMGQPLQPGRVEDNPFYPADLSDYFGAGGFDSLLEERQAYNRQLANLFLEPTPEEVMLRGQRELAETTAAREQGLAPLREQEAALVARQAELTGQQEEAALARAEQARLPPIHQEMARRLQEVGRPFREQIGAVQGARAETEQHRNLLLHIINQMPPELRAEMDGVEEAARVLSGQIDDTLGYADEASAILDAAKARVAKTQGLSKLGKARRVEALDAELEALQQAVEGGADDVTLGLLSAANHAKGRLDVLQGQVGLAERAVADAKSGKLGEIIKTEVADGLQMFRSTVLGRDMVGSPDVIKAITNLDNFVDDAKGFGKVLDGYTRFFKSYATLTPGYHTRNALSAAIMNATDGVSTVNQLGGPRVWAAYIRNPTGEWWKNIPERYQGVARDAVRAVYASGAGGQFSSPEVISRAIGRKGGRGRRLFTNNFAIKGSRWAGEQVEGAARMAMALDTLTKGGSFDEAVARLTRIHFNYSQASEFDQTMRRFIPFWTFMSRNLPLQVQQMLTNPRTYLHYQSFKRNFGSGDEGQPDMPLYIRELGGFRVADDMALLPDIGPTQLAEYAQDIARPERILSELNPAYKVPLQLLTNRNFFYGREYDPNDYTVPGAELGPLMPLLELLGGVEQTQAGPALQQRWADAARDIIPTLGMVNRLAGTTPDRELLTEQAALNFLGIPIRQLTPEVLEREQRRQRGSSYYEGLNEQDKAEALSEFVMTGGRGY